LHKIRVVLYSLINNFNKSNQINTISRISTSFKKTTLSIKKIFTIQNKTHSYPHIEYVYDKRTDPVNSITQVLTHHTLPVTPVWEKK